MLVTTDKPFDDFDVYEVDYLTHTETAPIRPTADAITSSVKEVIKPVMSRYRDVYLICHSLGGNVIRDYLIRIDAESPSELGRYRGLFLLGTPVESSSLSRFLDLFGLLTAGGRADVKGALGEISGGFKDKDHLSLPKPKDENDSVYKWVKSGIRDGHGKCPKAE